MQVKKHNADFYGTYGDGGEMHLRGRVAAVHKDEIGMTQLSFKPACEAPVKERKMRGG